MNTFLCRLKFLKDIILGKECYFPLQKSEKTKWMGTEDCGFYVVSNFLTKDSIVYSFGIGEDISFDESLISEYGCSVYAYDPTPKSKIFVEKKAPSPLFKYFEYGIAAYDGKTKFFLPANDEYVSCTTYNRWGYDESKRMPLEVVVKKLSTMMQENGHSHIDLLKMDVEGSEYSVIDNILEENISIKQICLEVHHRFPGMGIGKTKRMVRNMNKNGFYIVAISKTKEEYTFVHY